ncbi:hypothetical protein WKI65_31680 [Streptomyces sp. MS1.AVA.3]|uniref:hypothetical protein n=1 Tax=Streptomyces decoyicus TaxID=249567 RepID=UPI0030C54938
MITTLPEATVAGLPRGAAESLARIRKTIAAPVMPALGVFGQWSGRVFLGQEGVVVRAALA